MFISTVQQVPGEGEHVTRAHLLLDAVEARIASERGREVLREFLRTLMRDRHLRFLGEELASAANIVQGNKFVLFLMAAQLAYVSTQMF